jgi:spore coat protein U-like protein
MKIRDSLRLGVIALSAALAAGQVAVAGQTNGALPVSATVINNCILTAGAMAFGNYDPASANGPGGANAPLQAVGSITMYCTLDAVVAVNLDQGLHPTGGSTAAAPQRQMLNQTTAGIYLDYFLYSDNAYSTVWGNTVGTAVADTGSGLAQTLNVYGSVPASQNVPAASYADTVTVYMNF